MTEFELKFHVPPERLGEVAAALGLSKARRQRLQAAYFDTPDGRLAAHRLSLRLRKEARDWVQTLKAPGQSAVHRLEHNVRRPGRFDGGGPALEPGLHAGTPAGDALVALLSQAAAGAGAAALPPLAATYRVDVWRRTTQIRQAGTVVELALDEGELTAGDRRLPICELEFELVEGSPAALVDLAAAQALPHGLWLSTVSKAERGELLARGMAASPATHAEAPRLARGHGSALAVLRAALGACLEQVLANASVVAAGVGDAEHVHQLRVGLRRLRTALRELGGLAPAAVRPEWDEPLATVFSALGQVRDREVVAAAVAAQLALAGAPPLPPAPARMDVAPSALVRDVAFQGALLQILALASPDDLAAVGDGMAVGSTGDLTAGAAPKPRRLARKRLSRLHRQITRDARRFETLEVPLQHRVRKRLKRLRYLAELVAGLFEPKAVEKFVAALRPAQEALGEFQDLMVAQEMYRQQAEAGQGPAWFAVGWLAGQHAARARACRKALQKVQRAPVFW